MEEFGSIEQLCKDLEQKGSADAHLYKLSLISRLISTKETTDGKLKKVYSDAFQFILEQISIEVQPQIRIDLIVDTLGYLCLKS